MTPIRRLPLFLAVAALLSPPLPAAAGALPFVTERCNTNYGNGMLHLEGPEDLVRELTQAAVDPAGYPDLHRRLWLPKGMRPNPHSPSIASLLYETGQDTREIAQALGRDPTLLARGLRWAAVAEEACFAAPPPSIQVTVTEYYNRVLGHYFLSSSATENAIIESGGAGEGWERTGESFGAVGAANCVGDPPVFRFYGPAPNSHFFTADPEECGFQRKYDTGWLYEGIAFGATVPVEGRCPFPRRPVYRLYNDRWMHNDSNHRFVARLDLYEAMQARGWIGEGVAFCVRDR